MTVEDLIEECSQAEQAIEIEEIPGPELPEVDPFEMWNDYGGEG
jgi:hypothetical protein